VGRLGQRMLEREDLNVYLDLTRERRLDSLVTLLRIPSISGLPAHAADCRAAAERLHDDLLAIGMEHVEVAETGGHPVVYADWLHAEGRPTVLVYAHYDVQPAHASDGWNTEPFEPVIRDGRLIARGAADDKAQVEMHLRAIEALLATRGCLPVNLKLVIEGEEESSSIHLDAWLEANRERVAADLAVVSDTTFLEGNIPAVTVSLRGFAGLQIDVAGPTTDLHSGMYGGAVENPANALCAIIASLKDSDGRVLVPGFYDDVVELTDDERAELVATPFDERAYCASLGVLEPAGECGYGILERIGARPTLDVNGLWSGFEGEGTKTIIPAVAHAKISCRLVAKQNPNRILEAVSAYILKVAPPGVGVEIRNHGTAMPMSTPLDHPATLAAARAIEATFHVAPLYVRFGGSVPVAASFESLLGLPVVLLGFAPPNGNFHAPNEWMDLTNYETGIRTIARYWDELAEVTL